MKKKIGLVVAIIFIGALAFGISRVVQNPEQYQKTDPNIEAIMNSCEVTEAQAETIWGILQECGVGSIEIISRDTMQCFLLSPADRSGTAPILNFYSLWELEILMCASWRSVGISKALWKQRPI